jgi:hypothetical protein
MLIRASALAFCPGLVSFGTPLAPLQYLVGTAASSSTKHLKPFACQVSTWNELCSFTPLESGSSASRPDSCTTSTEILCRRTLTAYLNAMARFHPDEPVADNAFCAGKGKPCQKRIISQENRHLICLTAAFLNSTLC